MWRGDAAYGDVADGTEAGARWLRTGCGGPGRERPRGPRPRPGGGPAPEPFGDPARGRLCLRNGWRPSPAGALSAGWRAEPAGAGGAPGPCPSRDASPDPAAAPPASAGPGAASGPPRFELTAAKHRATGPDRGTPARFATPPAPASPATCRGEGTRTTLAPGRREGGPGRASRPPGPGASRLDRCRVEQTFRTVGATRPVRPAPGGRMARTWSGQAGRPARPAGRPARVGRGRPPMIRGPAPVAAARRRAPRVGLHGLSR